MSRQRFGFLLIAALVAISAAFYLNSRRNLPRAAQGASLIPSLAAELNSVTEVTLRKGSATPVTVHKANDHWTVAQRGDYPADVAKLRKLLVSLRDAKIVEEKTSDPSRYVAIGVEDPSAPGAAGAEITVVGPGGKHAIIVGKPVGEGNFVRRAGEGPSYSVEPAITVDTQPQSWIDSQLLDVPAAQIQSVEVKPATGAAYGIRRLKEPENSFSLESVPAGRKPVDARALAPTSVAGLNAEDVAPAADIDFGRSSQAIVTLDDDTVLTLTGAVIGDKHWLEVKSSKDSALPKTQGRAFEVASYRYDALFKPLEQLLVPQEPAATKKSPAPRPARAPHGSTKPAPAPAS